jgi:hypothetical protein
MHVPRLIRSQFIRLKPAIGLTALIFHPSLGA